MSTVIVRDGDLVVQDPTDIKVYLFDWDTDNLATGATLASGCIKVSAVGSVGTSIEKAITSITRSSTTATVTTPSAHGLTTGASVTIAGATQAASDGTSGWSDFNGTYTITVLTTTTFTYTVANSPTSPSTGTMTWAVGLDNVGVVSAAPYSSRYYRFRFNGAASTLGATYEFANRIVTDESPAQTKERSFRVRITNK